MGTFTLLPCLENIFQRTGRLQKCLTLLVGQIVILQRQQDVLSGGVRIGTVQNFFRGQYQEVLPIAFLLGKHLLVEQGVQFLIGDKINFLSFGVKKKHPLCQAGAFRVVRLVVELQQEDVHILGGQPLGNEGIAELNEGVLCKAQFGITQGCAFS